MQCSSCGKDTTNPSSVCNECEANQSGKKPNPAQTEGPVITFFRQNGLKILLVIVVIIVIRIFFKK